MKNDDIHTAERQCFRNSKLRVRFQLPCAVLVSELLASFLRGCDVFIPNDPPFTRVLYLNNDGVLNACLRQDLCTLTVGIDTSSCDACRLHLLTRSAGFNGNAVFAQS